MLIAHGAGFTALATVFFAMMAWLPAVLGRRLALSSVELGWTAGILVLLCCPAGMLAAGWLVDRIRPSAGGKAPFRVALFGIMAIVPAMTLVFVAEGRVSLLSALAIALFVSPWPLVLASLSLQTIVPKTLRAQMTAVFLLIANLVGQTGGVSLVAVLTDKVWHDPANVHRSLALICILSALLAVPWLLRAQRLASAAID